MLDGFLLVLLVPDVLGSAHSLSLSPSLLSIVFPFISYGQLVAAMVGISCRYVWPAEPWGGRGGGRGGGGGAQWLHALLHGQPDLDAPTPLRCAHSTLIHVMEMPL